jgi:hypothetical protein
MEQSIADDPPDPNYTTFVHLEPIDYNDEIAAEPFANSFVRLGNNLEQQAALGNAFRQSYEKFLGAEAAQNYEYTLLQTRYAREYCGLLSGALASSLVHLDSLESAIIATGWADSVFQPGPAQALQQRVVTSGFTQSEIDGMRAVGMTDAEIDTAEARLSALDLTGLTATTYRSLIDSLWTHADSAIAHFDSVTADLDGVLDRLRLAWTGFPLANIQSPDTVPEGTTVIFDGSLSTDPQGDNLTFAWDLDMDGLFDDASGDTASWPAACGDRLVGLQVVDTSGSSDVAYKRITVLDVNRIPHFTAALPDSVYISLDSEPSQLFSVAATDPDGDDPTFMWFIDDLEVGGGLSYEFVAADTGLFHVRVRVSDGNALSPDNYHAWRVRVVSTATGVDDLNRMPRRHRLYQNSPNPFNPYTVIRYDLPEPARVSLRVYDVTGRLVRVLLGSVPVDAGYQEAYWDGLDDRGQTVASGVYLYRIEAGSFVETRRMVLLR